MLTDVALTIAGAVLVGIFGIIVAFFLLGVDRIVTARMQARIGPPLTQPFTDMRKLFIKENVVPANAIPWLFNLAPVVALASAITILLYIPVGGFPPVLSGGGDLILVMYLLTLPALALVAGGFSSGSPYATVGAQREMVTMIAYEFPLAVVIIAIAWKLAMSGIALPFMLVSIQANPVWGLVGPIGIIGVLILLFVLLIVTPGRTFPHPVRYTGSRDRTCWWGIGGVFRKEPRSLHSHAGSEDRCHGLTYRGALYPLPALHIASGTGTPATCS